MSEIIGSVQWIYNIVSEPNSKAACSAQPTIFFTYQSSALDVAATTVNNIAGLDSIPFEPLRVFQPDTSDTVSDNSILAYIHRHNGWDTHRHVVGGVELTAEWTSLNVTSPTRAYFAHGRTRPMIGDEKQRLNHRVRVSLDFVVFSLPTAPPPRTARPSPLRDYAGAPQLPYLPAGACSPVLRGRTMFTVCSGWSSKTALTSRCPPRAST